MQNRSAKPTEVGASVGFCLGFLLCGLVCAKALCGALLLGSSSTVRQRAGFASVVQDTPSLNNNSLTPRMCVCDGHFVKRMDPLGRMGMKGSLTSERFCRRCWSASEVAGFRRRLARGSTLIPWAVWLLASPLVLVVFLPYLGNWPRLQTTMPSIAIYALGLDVALCLLLGALSLDWGAFKNLCINGHAFDPLYHVEVAFVDALYFDICAYSAVEERLATSIGAVILLDLIVITIIAYMRSARLLHKPESRRTRELTGRITRFTEAARPFRNFDTVARRQAEASGQALSPEMLGRPQGQEQADWGVGLSLMNFDFYHRRKRREERMMHGNAAIDDLEAPGGTVQEKAPRRAGVRRPTHPWLKEGRKCSPSPKGNVSANSKKRTPVAEQKPSNEFVAYALSIAHTRDSRGRASDSEDCQTDFEDAPLKELFHAPLPKKKARL